MPPSRARLSVIFFTVLVDLIGFGIILPILPYVAQRFGAGGLGLGVLMGSFSLMQFVANTILGRLSDRWGRRPILLLTMLTNAAGYTLFALADSYGALLVARLVSGLASGNIAVAQAYIADVTAPAERSKGMGLIGAAFGVGAVIGPAIGGLAGDAGKAVPALIAAALSLANVVLAWRILPESLAAGRRIRRAFFDVTHVTAAIASPRLRPLMLTWLIASFGWAGYITVLPLHAARLWQWQERQLGWFFVVVGVVSVLMQGFLFGHLARRFGDRRLVITGCVLMALGIGAVPLVARVPPFLAWTVVLCIGNSLFAPAATGLVSLVADPEEQGTILGVTQSLAALGRFAGPEVAGGLFDTTGAWVVFGGIGACLVGAAWTATAVRTRARAGAASAAV